MHPKDEDITYTNWGMTGGAFEPITDSGKLCSSVCLGDSCANDDHTWKVADCATSLQFICASPCKQSNTIIIFCRFRFKNLDFIGLYGNVVRA
jgi:hypothetical protein